MTYSGVFSIATSQIFKLKHEAYTYLVPKK